MTIAFEAPAFTTTAPRRTEQTDARFAATFLGLMGKVTAPLRRITDARLATVTGTVIETWDEGRTIWLRLRTANGATGLISLDMARALTIPASLYAVGHRVEIRGVAHTHRNLDTPFVAVRELVAA